MKTRHSANAAKVGLKPTRRYDINMSYRRPLPRPKRRVRHWSPRPTSRSGAGPAGQRAPRTCWGSGKLAVAAASAVAVATRRPRAASTCTVPGAEAVPPTSPALGVASLLLVPVTYTLVPLTATRWAQAQVRGPYLATNGPSLPTLGSGVVPKATLPVKLPVANTLLLAVGTTARGWLGPLAGGRRPVGPQKARPPCGSRAAAPRPASRGHAGPRPGASYRPAAGSSSCRPR